MYFNDTIYNIFMFPFEALRLKKHRRSLLRQINGSVLEIGAGTGANLKYYPFNHIDQLVLTDLDLSRSINGYSYPKTTKVTTLRADVQRLPFEDDQFDYVVFTLVFCSVPDPVKGLAEIKRVLKPGGKLLFIEHVLPKHPLMKKIFNHFSPVWERAAHNCHINRETMKTLKKAGFNIVVSRRFFQGVFVSGIATSK